jgi:hypothetical protein
LILNPCSRLAPYNDPYSQQQYGGGAYGASPYGGQQGAYGNGMPQQSQYPYQQGQQQNPQQQQLQQQGGGNQNASLMSGVSSPVFANNGAGGAFGGGAIGAGYSNGNYNGQQQRDPYQNQQIQNQQQSQRNGEMEVARVGSVSNTSPFAGGNLGAIGGGSGFGGATFGSTPSAFAAQAQAQLGSLLPNNVTPVSAPEHERVNSVESITNAASSNSRAGTPSAVPSPSSTTVSATREAAKESDASTPADLLYTSAGNALVQK